MFAWPPDKPTDAGNDDGAVTPGGGVSVSATEPFTAESSTSPPVSASRLIVTERPGLATPMSVRMPPGPWKPIVSAGATGTAGGASGGWLKLKAENRLFCRALSGVSAGRLHSFCMNDRIETLVLWWWYTPWRAYGLMMIIGVRAP